MSERLRAQDCIEQLRKGVMLAILNIDLERNGLTPDGNVRERLVKLLDETEADPPVVRPLSETADVVCQHGTALDVHCCHCHSGFIFDRDHECPSAPQMETTGDLLAYGDQERESSRIGKDREQYRFWSGWCAALQRLSPVALSRPHDTETLRRALESIANSSCCGCCQEAALVAKKALASPPSPETPPQEER